MSKQSRYHKTFGLETLEPRCLLALDSAAGIGVTAQYYNDTELQTLFANQLETALTQNWGNGVPVAGLNADQFSARFVGQIEATFTEAHTFVLNAEGGVRLWINGRKAIDRWSDSTVTNATTTVDFVSGRKYDLQLEFKETGGAAGFDLKWSSPSLPMQSLPTSRLFPSERGMVERRLWSSLAGSGVSALTSLSMYPNSPTSVSSLTSLEVSSTGSNQYGELLVGNLHPTTTGAYRFYISADDSAELWLSNSADPTSKQRIAFVTSPTAPRDWTASPSQQSAQISLVAGQAYAFEVIHKEDSGSDHVAVGWQQPGSSSITVIDGQYLSPPLPTVRVFSQNVSAAEGQSTPLSFVVQRDGSPLTNPLVVHYALRGTATVGLDYTSVTGTVTIPAGAVSETVSITALSDSLTEGPETVIFEIVDGPGYQVGLISERRSLGTIQDVRSVPAGGVQITPVSTLANSTRFGGTFQSVTVSPYNNVIQAAIATQQANSFNSQLKFNYNSPIQAGDLLWSEFHVRAIGTEGLITVVSEITTSPFTKSIERSFAIPTEWTRIQIPFASVGNTASGAAAFGFFLGSKVQTLQFADVSVRNFGPSRDITPTTYFLNNIGGSFGNSSTVNVTGQPFTTAVRINTVTAPDQSFKLQHVGRNSQKVAASNNIRLEYFARSISGANPRINAVVQQASGTFATLSSVQHVVTPTWTKYTIDATTTAAFDVNGLQAAFNVGFTPQSVEIADIKWTNLSAAVSLADLPSIGTPSTYVGRSGSDPWRDSADTRIDDARKASLTVNVIDPQGNPINGAVVSIQQKRHAFRFGSAIDGQNQILSPTGGSTATKYQSEIKRLFNTATIENSLKWPFYNEVQALEIANWVVANNLYLRGHNIVWPSRQNMPTSVWTQYDSIKATQGDVAAADYLRTTIQSRVQTAVNTFQGLAGEWDVVNEPFDNNDVMAILGDSVVNDWFSQVRTLSPNTERVLNDYDIFARNGNNTSRRANFDYWLGRLKSNDGNNANDFIERIGEQGHYNEGNLTDIAVLGQLIQTYHTQFALPIGITEFDVNTTDRQLQADYLRDFLTMTFSQSGVDEFIQWGFWSGKHWLPNAALYDLDFSIRPNGQVYEDLVFGNWWTDTRATTRNGAVSSEVFKGNYEITVTHGDQIITRTLSAFSADGAMTVEMDILPPAVPTLAPADNAINVPVSSNLVLTFNENIAKGTGNILIKRTSDNSTFSTIDVASTQVTISGATVTINPTADLESSTGYYVQIAAGAIRDLAGNAFVGISDTTTWNFTTLGVNDFPTNITLSNAMVAENASVATIVGNFNTTDPNPSDVFVYTLVPGTGSTDNPSFTIDSLGNLKTASMFDFESKSSYSVRVRSTDQGGLFVENVFTITVNNALEFNPNIQLGAGSNQRSNVRSLTVAFENAIEFDAGAFQVFRRSQDANGQLQLVPVTTSVSLATVAGGMTATLTFSGSQTRGAGSLIDGNYQLVINGDLIRTAGTTTVLDADRDGVAGGQFTYGAQAADRFFALYGDSNGDRVLNSLDFIAFRNSYRSSFGNTNYHGEFDFDGNGIIDLNDFTQFRSRYAKTLTHR